MKFTVYRTSKFHSDASEVEINTLDELKKFEEESNEELIVSVKDGIIEIYDDYRE